MRIALALRAFFAILFNAAQAQACRQALDGSGEEASPSATSAKPAPVPKVERSEAITLLATLQREARLVDLVMEPLSEYGDAEIGAAARDVLRDSHQCLQRLFDLSPLTDQPEGESLEVPAQFDPSRFRLVGQNGGDPPFQGQVAHHGWAARHCQLPQWTGTADSVLIVAPIEVDVN